MDRFAELQAKGWLKLNKEERAEYTALKPTAAPKENTSSETVTVSKTELNDIIQKGILAAMGEYKDKMDKFSNTSDVARFGEWQKSKEEKRGNPTARLKIYREDGVSEGGVLLDWKFNKFGKNEETGKADLLIYRIKVLYDDDSIKEFDVDWNKVMTTEEFEIVEIIKQDIEEQEMIKGQGEYPHSKNGYNYSNPGLFGTKAQSSDGTFDYVVKRKTVVCTVKRPNGKTLTLDSSRLNS